MDYKDIVGFWKGKKIKTVAELSAILDSYSINFAFHSGKIENDRITYYDTRDIFTKDGVSSYTGDLRTLFEIRNAKNAYELILNAFEERQPITEDFVKQIQEVLTVNTYDSRRYQLGERPGQYKLGDYVTGRKEVGALSEDVQAEMSELLEDISDVDNANALVAAAYFHAKFENIHPFSDGNGRTGRLLMNYFLLLHDHPPIIIHEEDRKAYYEALEQYDEEIEISLLVDFLVHQTEKTWDKFLTRGSHAPGKRCSLKSVIDSSEKKSKVQRAKKSEVIKNPDHER